MKRKVIAIDPKRLEIEVIRASSQNFKNIKEFCRDKNGSFYDTFLKARNEQLITVNFLKRLIKKKINMKDVVVDKQYVPL